MHTMKSIRQILLSTAGYLAIGSFSFVLLTACNEKEGGNDSATTPGSEDTAAVKSTEPQIAEVFLKEEPVDGVSVIELRKSAKAGDQVVVAGKIGGTLSPFTEGFATFVLADSKLETCDMTADDGCTTPWDACCETPEIIKASRLTVQIVDHEKAPLNTGLQNVEGLSELDELVITGEVAEGSNEENMILNATGIFLKKNWVAPTPEKKAKG